MYIKASTTNSASDFGLTANTPYCYTVSAYDAAGNESGLSGEVCGTTMALPQTITFKLPDTGQTTCYDPAGAVIACTGTGQDGEYSTNPMSFTDNGNSTITDNVTGLMWQKEDDNTTRTWADAGTYCDGLSLGGQTDWRLPEVMELMGIVDYGTYSPAVNTTYFPNTDASYYWSATTNAYGTSGAWVVNFGYGYVLYTGGTSSRSVRCVRGNTYPAASFTDNGNGTVTDNVTSLMWQKEDDNVIRTWQVAIDYCNGLSFAGYTDWHLPDIKELRSIVDNTTYSSAIDATYFPNTNASNYWSSTAYAYVASGAWLVDFYAGYVGDYDKSSSLYGYVRCVR